CDARFPNRLARFGIESFESAIDHWRDDFPLIDRNAAIHNTATDLRPDIALIDFRIPAPSLLPRARIDTEYTTPACHPIQCVVPDVRKSFLSSASLPDVVRPGQPEPAHTGRPDLLQRTVAGFRRSETIAKPFLTRFPGIPQRKICDPPRLLGLPGWLAHR